MSVWSLISSKSHSLFFIATLHQSDNSKWIIFEESDIMTYMKIGVMHDEVFHCILEFQNVGFSCEISNGVCKCDNSFV